MNIRKAGKKDIESIRNLEIEWEKEGISWGVRHYDKKELMKHIKKNFVYIAEENGKLIGYCIAKISKAKEKEDWAGIKKGQKFGWIDGIYIKKEYRSKGIGKILVQKVLEELKKKVNVVKLKAVSKNLRNLVRFYEKFGFKEAMSDLSLKIR